MADPALAAGAITVWTHELRPIGRQSHASERRKSKDAYQFPDDLTR
jgi:hypothetical protein